jgi:hypothetical protein
VKLQQRACPSPHPPGGRISTVGGTGEAPVRVARWWDDRREITNPRMIAAAPMIMPRDTTAAMITVSMKVAMRQVYSLTVKHSGGMMRGSNFKLRHYR